jgi:hypothetical protein
MEREKIRTGEKENERSRNRNSKGWSTKYLRPRMKMRSGMYVVVLLFIALRVRYVDSNIDSSHIGITNPKGIDLAGFMLIKFFHYVPSVVFNQKVAISIPLQPNGCFC